MVLHTDEWREVVVDGIVLHGMELIGVATGHADVARVSGLDHVVQRLHGLGDGGIIVEAVALKDVDIVELKTLQGPLNGLEDVLTQRKVS